MSPDQDRAQRGRDFEAEIAARGGRLVPGSGNQWQSRGDVVLGPLLLSAKAEAKRTWGRTRAQLRDAQEMALGTGLLPALAVLDDDGEQLVVVRVDDLVAALASEQRIVDESTKHQRRRDSADVPAVLRDL